MELRNEEVLGDYFVIKAEEDGVNVIGLTRGAETRFFTRRSWIKVKS
ncbi:hypothetical protein NBRC111894_3352 [Sporolactobacillus inulinus]|uniref:Transcription attenuation protein MtrB n=1 Tax=Sporolactobacillus inulinus TaxID=2078 RepID=A0A4Y1ZH80_9BACL|nr:hypothetical protein NBRC111894_3352 [Sporolactobacillus inulinus]